MFLSEKPATGGESRDIYSQTANYEFSDKGDEHIRNWLAVGIRDKIFSQKLQLMPTLTLSKAMQQVGLQTREMRKVSLSNSSHAEHPLEGGGDTHRPWGAAAAQNSSLLC